MGATGPEDDGSGEPIHAVLFDMGGVLVELGPLDELLGPHGGSSNDDEGSSGDGHRLPTSGDEFWPRWLASPSVRGLESGRCGVDEFARGLVDELGLNIGPAEVVERFARFPRGLYPGAAEVVASVSDGITTAVLSNTNPLHWETQTDHETITALCDRAFLSYQLGLVKPDRAIYQRVCAELGLPPERVLFLDDNQINVDGAHQVGMRAEVVKGPAQAAQVLADHGLTD